MQLPVCIRLPCSLPGYCAEKDPRRTAATSISTRDIDTREPCLTRHFKARLSTSKLHDKDQSSIEDLSRLSSRPSPRGCIQNYSALSLSLSRPTPADYRLIARRAYRPRRDSGTPLPSSVPFRSAGGGGEPRLIPAAVFNCRESRAPKGRTPFLEISRGRETRSHRQNRNFDPVFVIFFSAPPSLPPPSPPPLRFSAI